MSRKTGKNGKGFGKPNIQPKPDYEGARTAGILISTAFYADVELRKCNFCTDYFLVIPGKVSDNCEHCGKVDYQLIETIERPIII